jgi:hypothetical protein
VNSVVGRANEAARDDERTRVHLRVERQSEAGSVQAGGTVLAWAV